MNFSNMTSVEIDTVFRKAAALGGRSAVEGVAQSFTEMFYSRYEKSLVLTRVFATIPMGRLPRSNRDIVSKPAASTGISDKINDYTMVLSLLGTSGRRPEWNDRRSSKDHAGIPLASGTFVDSIPMISRLLKEIGLDLDWIDDWDTKIVSKGFLSRSTGMFYVRDARTAVDRNGRKIIAAQDFVDLYDVRTVFGFGVGFLDSPTLLILIAFASETIDEPVVRSVIPVMGGLKRAVMGELLKGNFFESDA